MTFRAPRDALLEREEEVASLDALVGGAVAGEAHLALLEGPAGIGKSRLVAEARHRAVDARLRVLAARGGELERDFPFGVVRQLFETEVSRNDARVLTGAASSARAVFEVGIENGNGDAGADPSFATLHGLYWLTVNLTVDGPLVLTVDDLHWCDRASLRFLAYLLRRLEGLPALIVATLRPAQTGADAALLGEIAGDPLTVAIHPRPLSESAVTNLIRERLGHDAAPSFSTACHTATGGNPLLLHELLKALAAEGVQPDAARVDVVTDLGPRAVSRAVLLRLARLPRSALLVAKSVAVLGDGADMATVAALGGISEQEAGQGVSALAKAEILHTEAPLGFVHPLVGAAIYGDIPPVERAAQHKQAARLLTAAGTPPEQVATHLVAAPARGESSLVDTLRRAARSALQKGAADSAVAFLGRALAEGAMDGSRVEILLELGRAEALTSGPAAVEHLSDAYEMIDDPVLRATTAQALARALLFTGRPNEGAAIAREAGTEVPSELDDLRKALEAFELLAVLFGAGDPEQLRRLEKYRTRPPDSGVGAKMLAALAAQDWMYACGPSRECAELSLAALAGGELIAADNGLLATCAITNLVFADRDEALEWWEVARADAHSRGSLFAISSLNLWLGYTLYRRGDLADAEASLRTALDEFELWGYGREQAQIYCHAFLSAVLLERGDAEGARAVLERSTDPGGHDDGARYWLNSHIELLLAEGRFEDALGAADAYELRFSPMVQNPMDAPWRSHKAVALHRLGREGATEALVEEELVLAREWGAPGTVARSLRTLAMLSPEQELDRLREAVELLSESPARLEHAKSIAALGSALRRSRQPKDAREPLRQALELAEVCDAGALADHARAELAAAGGRPRPAASRGIESLTASERRVAALAAEGASNRDIAQALFVTPKTVEAHLSSAYRKLEVGSRHELPAALAVGS